MTKKERLEALVNHYSNGNKAQFASRLGISAQGLSTWLSRNTYDTELIYAKCEGISPAWLLSGTGPMLMDNSNNTEIETRPRIPLDAAAGSLSIVSQSISENECERFPVITRFPRYDFTIMVRGNSMEPEFHSGDEIACRIIEQPSFIQWGRPHVIDTQQGVVLKRIYNRTNSILCKSDNADYEDFEIPKTEILHIALVVGSIRLY